MAGLGRGMWGYLLRRILIFVPTLTTIIVLSFLLSQAVPGDPAMAMMHDSEGNHLTSESDRNFFIDGYQRKRREMGLDLPVFYFSVTSAAYPDTLNRIPYQFDRKALERLVDRYGNWNEINNWYAAIRDFENQCYRVEADREARATLRDIRFACITLRRAFDPELIQRELALLKTNIDSFSNQFASLNSGYERMQSSWSAVEAQSSPGQNYIPSFRWHGGQNQFHRWVSRVMFLDFGDSYINGKPVMQMIKERLPWTLFLNLLSLLFAYCLAVPLGIFSARNRGKFKDQAVTLWLYVLASLPAFWVALMLITFFANPEYIKLFPSFGLSSPGHENMSFIAALLDTAWHLILPTICYLYGSLSFLSRQMRNSMIETMGQDFIRTARAKGLPEKQVVWRHGLRNSLLPLITHFGFVFPALIAGSIVVESIFGIPGMGSLVIQSYGMDDYPTLIAIFTFAGILTLIGSLVADILYALVDPRISFAGRK